VDAFEDNFFAVGGDVEVADVEVGGKVGELAFGSGREVEEPEIFVLNFAAQKYEC